MFLIVVLLIGFLASASLPGISVEGPSSACWRSSSPPLPSISCVGSFEPRRFADPEAPPPARSSGVIQFGYLPTVDQICASRRRWQVFGIAVMTIVALAGAVALR